MVQTGKQQLMVLIGGMPRAGTTLMAEFVRLRFGIPVAPETHFFDMAGKTGRVRPDALPKEVMENRSVADAYDDIRDAQVTTENFRALLSRILGAPDVLGEKTPAHLMSFGKILSCDRDTVCVVVSRDFFSVIQSLRRMPWNNAGFRRNLRRCVRYHVETFRLQRAHPARIMVIGYRELCECPDRAAARLGACLPRYDRQASLSSFDPSSEPWKARAQQPPTYTRPTARGAKERLMKIIADATECGVRLLWPLRRQPAVRRGVSRP